MMVQYVTHESPSGDSGAISVDIPTPLGRRFVVVQSIEVATQSTNGRRNMGPMRISVVRYDQGVDGAARDSADGIGAPFLIPICGPRAKEVQFYRTYEPYSAVDGIKFLEGKGFRVTLTGKARASDYARLQIGYITLGREDTQ